MVRQRILMSNQRDQLLYSNQERNRINKTKETQNDETRQPIGISAREKLVQKALVVHGETLRMRPTKVQRSRHRTPRDLALGEPYTR